MDSFCSAVAENGQRTVQMIPRLSGNGLPHKDEVAVTGEGPPQCESAGSIPIRNVFRTEPSAHELRLRALASATLEATAPRQQEPQRRSREGDPNSLMARSRRRADRTECRQKAHAAMPLASGSSTIVKTGSPKSDATDAGLLVDTFWTNG